MPKNLMNKSGVVAVVLLLLVTRLMAAETYGNWPYYKDFTINTSSSGANVANNQYKFPLLIRLSASDSAIFNKAQANGADIRFSGVTSSGAIGTHFPYQREIWNNTNKAAVVWVLVDTLKGNSTTQKIRMYWGVSTASDSSKSTAVFETANGFQGVWHLNEATGAAAADATANAYNGVPRGRNNGSNKPADTTGIIGRAKYFNGGSDTGIGQRDTSYYVIPASVNSQLNFPDTNGSYMISAWVNSDTMFAIPGRDRAIVNKGGSQYELQIGSADPTNNPPVNYPNFGYVDVSKSWRATFSPASTRAWSYLVAVHNGAHQYIYVNGICLDSTVKYYGTNATRTLTDTVAIGGLADTKNGCLKGYIEEVHIENIARSPDWIKLAYANQKAASSMPTPGPNMVTPPSNLTYWPDSVIYTITGAGISPDTPTVTGLVDSFSFNPPTPPAGLYFDKKLGKVTGNPTAAQATTSYTVIAYNAGGTDTVILKIAVISTLTAPTNLNYRSAALSCAVGTAIVADTPTVTGTVTTWSISATLPAGLSFNTANGIISGTPTATISTTQYYITAGNSAGSTKDTVAISVAAAVTAPTNLNYRSAALSCAVGTAIVADTPTVTGTVVTWTISPALTSIGLSLNTSNGIISGIPTAATSGPVQYIITAANTAGSAKDTVTITVIAAPTNLNYRSAALSCAVSTAIVADTPTVTGTVTTWTISPTLTSIGLSLNTANGIISGTPTAVTSGPVQYVITAANSAGSTKDTVTITVSPAPPSNLTYSTPTPTYYPVNVTITPDTPHVQGAVVSYHAPQLPAGLQIDTASGIITGQPTTVATGNYTVTASNAGGSANTVLNINVYAPNSNPIVITGNYVSSTQVKITISNYATTLRSSLPPPYVDSVQIVWKNNGFPDSLSGTTIKSYSLPTLIAAGTQDTVTLTFPAAFLTSDSVGIGSAIIWNDLSRTVSTPANDAKVAMRDTTTPANGLFILGIWDSGTTIANIYLDSVSSKTIDTTKIQWISIWYGTANAGYFTNDQTSDFTKLIPASTVLHAAKNGRYTDYDTNSIFQGQSRTIYCAVRLTGFNLLNSPPSYNSFGVGNNIPQNPLKLTAMRSPIDSTGSIILNWSPIKYSVRIWYGVNQALLTPYPTDLSLLVTPASLSTDSSDTVHTLSYGTTYYFGAQALINGVWTGITSQSTASATTSGSVDTTALKNTAKVTGDTLDPLTHVIKVRWTVDTAGLSGKSLQIGIVYSLKGWPLDTANLLLSPNIKQIRGVTGVDTLKLGETLLFDTTYYIGLWLRTSTGAWSPAVDTAAMGKLHTPSFSWQTVTYGGVNDTVFAFNRSVRIVTDASFDPTSDTLKYSAQIPAGALAGFIPVSIGFAFTEQNHGPRFYVGVRYDSIPSGRPLSDIRIYLYNAATNSFMLDTDNVSYDTVGHYVYVKTNNLGYPFIAMVDTMAPRVAQLGTDGDSVVASGQDIVDTFSLSDNISNVRCIFEYTKGGNSYADGVSDTVVLSRQTDTIPFSIIGDFVSPDYGLRAHIIVSDGVHNDTMDLSRQVIRATSSDITSVDPLKWTPLRVTAYLYNPADTSALKGLAVKGKWKYDPVQFRLFRYSNTTGNPADTNTWVEYSNANDSLFAFYPGRLIWIKTLNQEQIDFGGGITPSLKQPDTIVLKPDTWSDIALPYKFNIRIGDIIDATNGNDSVHYGDSLYYYSWKKVPYGTKDDTSYTTLNLFISKLAQTGADSLGNRADSIKGIASIFNPFSVPVRLIVPPTPTSMSKVTAASAKKKISAQGWSLGIKAVTLSGKTLNAVYCGYSEGKGAARYFPLPPSFDHVSMSVVDARKRRYAHVITQGNWKKDGGVRFDLAFANTSGSAEEVDLSTATYGNVPNGNFRIALFDPATGVMSEAGKSMRVVVGNNACEYREIVAGSEAYLAEVKLTGANHPLALIGAYPNPFKRSLRIQYSVPVQNIRQLDFSIVNVSGREIWRATLKSDALASGLGTVAWNGMSRDNGPVASGLYIVRMAAIGLNGKTSGVFEKRITFMP